MTETNTTAETTDTADEFKPIGTASYSVEDNKLRLYPFARLSAEVYERVKSAGFTWAPKQELFVAGRWTPEREDLLIELCGEIDDEDYSATERAADRAERFENYRDKRAAEAGVSADTFDAGPQAFGHQNRARAERQAKRHDRHRTYAVSQWSKAEYWQERTAGVIRNAMHKANPRVRRGRIKELEADQRRHEKDRAEYAERFALWSKVPTLDGADQTITEETYQPWENKPELTSTRPVLNTPAALLAYKLANTGGGGWEYEHPRTGKKSSLYSHLTAATDPLTPGEAAALWLAWKLDPADPETRSARWSAHYENRLTYERAMLANEGGTAADVEMVPGGWINTGNRTGSMLKDVAVEWKQIHAITRSPVTKKITSVKVMGTVGYRDPKPGLVSVNVERLGEGNYRAPTAEELEAFTAATKQAKAEKKATTPKAPSLINPTDADAEKLQAEWNATALAKFNEKKRYGAEYKPAEVLRMTQEEYSARSKGEYALCETRTLHACGKPARRYSNMWTSEGSAYDKSLGETVCKIRVRGVSDFYTTDRVIVITDKPQKPLPLDWEAITAGTVGQAAEPVQEQPAEELAIA